MPGQFLEGVVFDSSGPVVGAVITLSVLISDDAEWEGAWLDDDWGFLERTTLEAESDASGRFTLTLPESAPEGWVLWTTHVGHLAKSLFFGGKRDTWPSAARIALEEVPAMQVSVRDSKGRPVVGARVDQFGLAPPGSMRGTRTGDEIRARRLLARSFSTGPDGSVQVGAFPDDQVLVASLGAERSRPWRGRARARVSLDLVPTFTIGGRVVLPDWRHLNYEGERRITIGALQKNMWRPLHVIRSAKDGAWGPVTLPLLDVERYRVRLEGSPIVPVEVFFAPPAVGAEQRHDLVAELGVAIWIQAMDEHGRVIPEAVAKVQWQDRHDPEHWNFVERSPYSPGHPVEGVIGMWSVPPGTVMVEVSAPGYVKGSSGLLATEVYVDGILPFVLARAARIEGRCLHAGQPITDFEVLTWRTSDRASYTSTQFFDREDGSFELDTAPEGQCWITACSGTLPACDPKQIGTSSGNTTEVLLELPGAIRGVGQVVDEESGEPIPDASVQLFVPGDVLPIARWGDPIPAGTDGVFTVDGFRPGTNDLRILAGGYSRKVLTRTAIADEQIDWGVVALSRAHTLTVVLEDASGENQFEGVQVAGTGEQTLIPRMASASGTVEFPDVSAGSYELTIDEPDDTHTAILAQLLPGRDWTIRHRIAGPNYLTLELTADDPRELAGLSAITVSYASPLGYVVNRSIRAVSEGLRALEMRGIDAASVQAEVYDTQFVTRATASGAFQDGRLHLTLALGGKPFVLSVVDPDGRAIGDVRVGLSDPRSPGSMLIGSTDSAGRCEFKSPPETEVLVSLRHGIHGMRLGVPVDTRSGSAQVTLDSRASLRVQFRDGDTPLVGVSCWLFDPAGPEIDQGESGKDGLLTIAGIGEGPYRLHASRSNCWPREFSAHARVEAGIELVQLRRLGDLQLELVAPGGLPVSGIAVELTSREFGVSVARWIDEQRVRATSLVTDLRGRVQVEGLPNGSYGWRITLPDGERLDGELLVEFGSGAPVRVVLPE